ncbi:pectinesterase/pectinesterase inhibitor PPE8B-like [Ipomoea triloba]|uniref:pectinesterase/pectinesterase inhibitor PPE8B-like n=1 Tax=Ipomoea triloba TaxID=35885 RepID=UPI00125DE7B6|nr:pectinesterase/pectinesterase inhibitor PPE8B-like [Ipomoea triloba]
MARSLLSALFLVILCVCNLSGGGDAGVGFDPAEILKVSAPDFVESVKTTIDVVQQVTSVVAKVGNVFGDFRLSNAVSDCLDLLDLSADELSSTLLASQNPIGKRNNSTGNLSADLRAWLSGAMINQDTCIEGFDGTDGLVKNLVAGTLNQISSSIRDVLAMVRPIPPGPKFQGRKLIREFPSWLKSGDRRLLQSNVVTADAVVALDGTGNFTSIKHAISAAPELSSRRYVIYVKKGVYREYIEIGKKKWNIVLIGDGMDQTVISGNRSYVDGWTTYKSATFAVKGQGFIARDVTFENTAGPEKHQAVAFRSDSDLSVLFRCAIRGYQDTLYAHSMRQFYRECKITGTVDFIFGDSTAVFQSCEISARKGLPNQKNTITAHGRKDPAEPTGFSIQFCNITAEPELLAAGNSTASYLGRPWRLYSRTVFMQSYISSAIRPEGWLEWDGDYALDSLFYGEFSNYGPGAGLGNRVKWPGYHLMNESAQAHNFTVAEFILGNSWLPSTGVKYAAGLSV